MAQTIKLKRGLSTQVGALTLVPGEPAVCTDTGDFYVGTTAGKSKVNRVDSVNGKTGVVTITEITGNSGTTSKLKAPVKISLSGDVTGEVTFDGSSNVSIPTTLGASFEIDGGTF